MTKVRTSQLAQTGAATGQALVWNGTYWLPGAYDDATKVAKALYTAKGILLVGSAAGTPTGLAVGANNFVLTADSATATGVKWATPAPDASKVALATIDAVGDLLIGTGDNTVGRLGIGTNGHVLTADSGAPGGAGLAWKALPIPDAASIPVVPFGTIEATNVQAALEELSAEGGSGGGGGGGGHIIEEEGTALAQRAALNFVGLGVTVSDDPTNEETRVEISGATVTEAAFTRTSVVYTSASLAPEATETGLMALAPGYRLYTITTSRPARVRLYENAAKRDADLLRGISEVPAANSGLMLDYVTVTGQLSATLSPLVDGYVHTGSDAAISVQNLATAGVVATTLTYKRTE